MWTSAALLVAACNLALAKEDVKVYVLAGQSNMEGKGKGSDYDANGTLLNGTLLYLLKDPRTADHFAKYWDESIGPDGNWSVIDGVKVWFNEYGSEYVENVYGRNETFPCLECGRSPPCAVGDASYVDPLWYNATSLAYQRDVTRSCSPCVYKPPCTFGEDGSFGPHGQVHGSRGSLTVGFGTNGRDPTGNYNWNKTVHPWRDLFGPELGFGYGLHEAMPTQKILLLKTAWGGKSLGIDFRPPSSAAASKAGTDPHCTNATLCNNAGHFYETMVSDVHRMLKPGVIGRLYPAFKGLDVNLAGVGWFQGWNDACDPNMTAAYETNLANLVTDLRAAFRAKALPVSIAVCGQGGYGNRSVVGPTMDITAAQFAVANATRHPELGGHVVAMDTRGFWREAQFSADHNQGYHYWWNAETHALVGEAMAKGMIKAAAGAATDRMT